MGYTDGVEGKQSPPVVVPGLDLSLTQDEATRLAREDPVYVAFVLLALSAEVHRLREALPSAASAPSSATPVYQKPTSRAGRRQRTKRGAKPGHVGHARPVPLRIDRTETHALHQCPECGTSVTPGESPSARRTRIIEDIPQQIESEVVEHVIERAYCPVARKWWKPRCPMLCLARRWAIAYWCWWLGYAWAWA